MRKLFYFLKLIDKGNKNSDITKALLYYICKDNEPFSTVDDYHSGFKYFLKNACPLYLMPSRNTIKNKLNIKYNYLSKKFKGKLKLNINFTLTSDIWIDIQLKNYLGVTIHFLHTLHATQKMFVSHIKTHSEKH